MTFATYLITATRKQECRVVLEIGFMAMIVITELSGKRMAVYQEISVKVISKQSQQSVFFFI